MKSAVILTYIAAMLASKAEACFQVHNLMVNDLFAGDTMSITVKDNNVEVCKGTKGRYLASTDDEFCLEPGDGCSSDYRVCVTNNGKSGYVENVKNGYRGQLALQSDGSQTNTYDCYCTDSRCGKCTNIESCLDDNFWDCDLYPYCKFCDYRTFC